MGSWKCGTNIYTSHILRAILKPTHPKDGFMLTRESIFFRLLSYSSDNYEFEDYSHFSKFSGLPLKQCQIVWSICITEDVLKFCDHGYSAFQWLKENGLMIQRQKGDKWRLSTENKKTEQDNASDNRSTEECSNQGNKKPSELNSTNSCQINPKEIPNDGIVKEQTPKGRNVKLPIRDNVFLSENEMIMLRAKYNEDEINIMLDYLSSYKKEKNKDYVSDYAAILRWVVKWYTTTHSKNPYQENAQTDFPSWITGG